MADSNSGDNGGGNGLTIIVGLVALALVGGVGYWYYTKKKGDDASANPANPASATSSSSEADKPTTDRPGVGVNNKPADKKATANTPATGDGMSPMRADHDAKWNYQKRHGVWYTAKKDGSVQWTSLAKNQKATDSLNAAYPND